MEADKAFRERILGTFGAAGYDQARIAKALETEWKG